MTTSSPRIYISSTIYDFRDLRSALKYWLEGLGYEVMLSDYNDFDKPLDENSYIACLRAIEKASYFILLVGARVGGFYNSVDNISITRMEYRTAYESVKAGKLKLATFVRQELWDIREDRKALKEFLINDQQNQTEIGGTLLDEIVKHPSKFVNDAEVTFEFLKEIGRVEEMKEAMAGKAGLPRGNWIHTFSTFGDIVEALQTTFGTRHSLSRVALETNLRQELLSNIVLLTGKYKDDIHFNTQWGEFARARWVGGLDDSSKMPGRYLKWLGLYGLFRTRGERLSSQFIDQALTSGEFLEYDFKNNSYVIGPVHKALFALKENIQKLRNFSEKVFDDRIMSLIDKYSPKNNPAIASDKEIIVTNQEILPAVACCDCERNVADLAVALFKALHGDLSGLSNFHLRASTPDEKMAEEIKNERTSVEEIEEWLKTQISPVV